MIDTPDLASLLSWLRQAPPWTMLIAAEIAGRLEGCVDTAGSLVPEIHVVVALAMACFACTQAAPWDSAEPFEVVYDYDEAGGFVA